MTRFAKIAAETVYDPETDDAPSEKVPSWKRALPWIAGGLGAAGLGYAAYKGLGPKAEASGMDIGSMVGMPLAMASKSLGGAVNVGLGAGLATAGTTAAADTLARRHFNGKNQSLSEIIGQGNTMPDADGKVKSFMKDTLMVGKSPHDQEKLHAYVGGADDAKLLTPVAKVPDPNHKGAGTPKMVDAIHNTPTGGTAHPIEAIKLSFGDNHIDEAIKAFDHYSKVSAPGTVGPSVQIDPRIIEAERLMGGRQFDPAAMHSQLQQIKTHATPLGKTPIATGMSRAVRRGGAAGILATLITSGSNILVQAGKSPVDK